eukprot:6195790-Pleurochrysis_carterae.AAC.1
MSFEPRCSKDTDALGAAASRPARLLPERSRSAVQPAAARHVHLQLHLRGPGAAGASALPYLAGEP